MNKYLKYFIFMVILGLIVSLSLSFINELTAPIIEEQKLKKVEQKSLFYLMQKCLRMLNLMLMLFQKD